MSMTGIVNLKTLAVTEPFSSKFARLGDLYVLTHINTEQGKEYEEAQELMRGLNNPLRMNGMLFLLVQDGCLKMMVNTEYHEVCKGDVVIVRPGTLMTINEVMNPSDFTIFFISNTFLNSINLDINSYELRSILTKPRTVMKLSEQENEIVKKYFELLDLNTLSDENNTPSVFAQRIARTLISAISYEMLRIASKKIFPSEKEPEKTMSDIQGRAQNYFYRFMQLLHVHYSDQRNLQFYATQLCITPKYLSMLTKELTGHTASEWIDRVVIVEAKNLLQFSDKSIQQIADTLNFPSQSAFGKYFKRITGRSPSEFLKNSIN